MNACREQPDSPQNIGQKEDKLQSKNTKMKLDLILTTQSVL